MAPIKFEEHIKEKLDERTIQPSADSWDKLSSRLNDNSKNSSGRKWWIPAAAAVIVLMIASLVFVNNQNDQVANPIVEKPDARPIENKGGNEFETPVQVASEEKKEEIRPEVLKHEIQKPVKERPKTEIAETNDLSSEETESLAINNNSERQFLEPVSIDPPEMIEASKDEYSDKIQELLAKVAQAEKEAGNVTEAEVDALLAEAAREISSQRNKLPSEEYLSAATLLADVEYEVDQSFRKEIFDFLKEEFLKAKTAVATRND